MPPTPTWKHSGSSASPSGPPVPVTMADHLQDQIQRIARNTFGWSNLRDGQATAVASLMQGRDTVAIMPTGFGKSAIYQIAGELLEGLTLVVSPLIALQIGRAHV